MKAIIVDRDGRKDGVRFGEMPEPGLRDDDVLAQIHATSGGAENLPTWRRSKWLKGVLLVKMAA
jgi:hypothetical protein